MATLTAAEHREPLPQQVDAIARERPVRDEPRRISIDANFVTIAGLLALALAAFAYLNSRIDSLGDSLGGRIDSVATELRTEIKQLGVEMKRHAERTDDKVKQLGEEMKRYTERTDDKIDRLTDKINELLINQNRGN